MRTISEIEREEYQIVDRLSRGVPAAKRQRLINEREALRREKNALLRVSPSVLRKSSAEDTRVVDQNLIDAIARVLAPIVQKIGKDPAPKDAPDAPMPIPGGLGSGYGSGRDPEGLNGGVNQLDLAAWRAPGHLRNTRLHNVGNTGTFLDVPAHGVCHPANVNDHDAKCDCSHCKVAADLKSRGFTRFQSKKSASEIVDDGIRAILAAGTQKSLVMDRARHIDKTGALAASVGADPMRWFHDRAQKNSGEVPSTSWHPRDEFIKRQIAAGYIAEAEAASDARFVVIPRSVVLTLN